jgi:MFS family permease
VDPNAPPWSTRLVRSVDVRRRLVGLDIYYGWFVVAACFLGGLLIYGLLYTFSVFFGHLVTAFGLSHADTSLIFSLQSMTMYVGAAAFGFLLDRYDVRRLFALASVLIVGGLFGTSVFGSYLGALVCYGLAVGTGFGIILVIAYVTPVLWFERRRGVATGIATAGAGVGMMAMPPFARLLIESLGWQRAYLALASLVGVALLAATLVIAGRPERLDIDTAGEFPAGTEARASPPARQQLRDVRSVVSSWAFVAFFLAMLGAYLVPLSLSVNFVEFAKSVGLDPRVGVFAISVIGATNTLGKFVTGYLADRTETILVLAGNAVAIGVLTLPIVLIHEPGVVLATSALFGFGYAGLGALTTPMMAELFGDRNLNGLFGVVSISSAFAGALGPYLANLWFDAFGTYVPVFIGMALISVLAAGLFVLAPRLAS